MRQHVYQLVLERVMSLNSCVNGLMMLWLHVHLIFAIIKCFNFELVVKLPKEGVILSIENQNCGSIVAKPFLSMYVRPLPVVHLCRCTWNIKDTQLTSIYSCWQCLLANRIFFVKKKWCILLGLKRKFYNLILFT